MIVGGRITYFEGKKLKNASLEKWEVTVNFEDFEEENGKLLCKYSYEIRYEPEVARMVIKGELLSEEKNAKEIAEKWSKNKQIPGELTEELLTSITYAASAVGTLLAFGLGITAPINVPRAKLGTPAQSKSSKAS